MKQQKQLLSRILYLTGLTTFIGSAVFAVSGAESSKPDPIRNKAQYYFLQGSIEAAAENVPQAYEYFKKAYELDPSFEDAAFNYGSQRIFMQNDTLQTEPELKRSLRLMQSYVDAYPKDVYATRMYGYITTALDTVEESIRVYENTYNLIPSETHLLPVLAEAYLRLMNGEKAINSLERYEAIEGKSQDVSLKKTTIYLALQDTIGARKEVEGLVEAHPNDPYSFLLKGNFYEIINQKDSVLKAYKDAEKLAPDNGAVKMNLANYYRSVGDSVMFDTMIYETLLSEDYQLEEKISILGDYLQKMLDESGDRSRGDHLFSVLQEQYPHEPEVLEMAARYEAAKGDYEGAVEATNYAIDVDPTNEKLWLMLLSFEITDSKYEKAVEDYHRAKNFVTPGFQLKNLYAGSASMLKDTDREIKILNELLEEVDQRLPEGELLADVRKTLSYDELAWVSSLYSMLGDAYYKKGEPDEGFKEYEHSLFFLSDNALALNNYAYFLSEEGKELEKARKMSKRSLELDERNPTYLDTYAWILYKSGDYKEALEYIEAAIDIANQIGDDNEEYQQHYEAIKEALEKNE